MIVPTPGDKEHERELLPFHWDIEVEACRAFLHLDIARSLGMGTIYTFSMTSANTQHS